MNNLVRQSKIFLNKNASTILTFVGSIGVVATAVMAVKETPKALTLLEQAKNEKGEDLSKLETVKVAAPVYIPSILIGASTIACIFGANILNKRTQAALMSAYALANNTYSEYKEKVKELYGEEADNRIREELAKDNYKDSDISVGEDKCLFYDEFSERYFESTLEEVKEAEYMLNREMAVSGGVFLNEFYDLLNIPRVDYGDYLGWSACQLVEMYWYSWIEFHHEKVVMDDGLECYILTFPFEPTADFQEY